MFDAHHKHKTGSMLQHGCWILLESLFVLFKVSFVREFQGLLVRSKLPPCWEDLLDLAKKFPLDRKLSDDVCKRVALCLCLCSTVLTVKLFLTICVQLCGESWRMSLRLSLMTITFLTYSSGIVKKQMCIRERSLDCPDVHWVHVLFATVIFPNVAWRFSSGVRVPTHVVPYFVCGFRQSLTPTVRRYVFHVWHFCGDDVLVSCPSTRT